MTDNIRNGRTKKIVGDNTNMCDKLICIGTHRKEVVKAFQCYSRSKAKSPLSLLLFSFVLSYTVSKIPSERINSFANQASKLLLAFAYVIASVIHSRRDVWDMYSLLAVDKRTEQMKKNWNFSCSPIFSSFSWLHQPRTYHPNEMQTVTLYKTNSTVRLGRYSLAIIFSKSFLTLFVQI